MSAVPTSSHAYGVGIMAVIVAVGAGIVFYQMFYLPESLERPSVDEHILHPVGTTEISMIMGSGDPNQVDNFMPKLPNIELTKNNLVVWINDDNTPHTVTPDHRHEDGYSGEFGSPGVVLAGEAYEFLFTEEGVIGYHCQPHPWMTGTLTITKSKG